MCVVIVFVFATSPSAHPKPATRAARSHGSPKVHPTTTPATPSTPTFLGPDGVQSTAVIAENRRPGTSAWMIQPGSGSGSIQGFANLNYAAAGQSVALYVSTTASEFQVTAYRMGWYQGLGARDVWSSSETPGLVQPPCPVTAVTNMVSCDNWTPSLTLAITAAFVPGDYLLKLVGDGGQQSYVPLTIWDPTSHAAYLIMNRSFTEQGWNTYGGYDFYQGQGPCPKGTPAYPVCNRARVVSFDRPYAEGNGSADFLTDEYPMIEFAEEHGLDVSYCTDLTVDENPGVLLQHRVLLSLGHDESWSYPERQAAVAAHAAGVNIVFFGAAAVLRHVRMQGSSLGTDREEVDYRDSAEDPLNGTANPDLVTGNTWSAPPTNWSENSFVGQMYSGYLDPGATAPFVVSDASAWLYKGTGLKDGSSLPGMIRSDIDHLAPPSQTPADLQVLAHSPVPLTDTYTNQGRWGGETYSDMTYYTDPVGQAGVLDTGDTDWINALTPCPTSVTDCPADSVATMTGNILWLFGQGPAGDLAASVSNWKTITPAGS